LRHYYPHPILAKEGWLYIALSVMASIIVFSLLGLLPSIPFMLISIFVIQFFRDPPREVPQQANVIVAPADGKVICVEETTDEYQQQRAVKISIFMNVFNVHSNRSPVDGVVEALNYIPGKFVNADFDKASSENERNAMIVRLANGDKITCVQIAGLVARRILCYTSVGSSLTRGQRYGFIRFGSRVDIYLPLHYKTCVTLGEKVQAGSSIIAQLT